jgi:hypothetical protein
MHGAAPDQRLSWRFATAADIQQFYGGAQHPTMRAVVIELDGAVTAIVGLARRADHAQFFSEFREQLRPHLKRLPIMRAIKQVQAFAKESRLPVLAVAEETEPDAVRILSRLGFEHHAENVFRWSGNRPE